MPGEAAGEGSQGLQERGRLCKPRGRARLPRDVGGSDPDSGGATAKKAERERRRHFKIKNVEGEDAQDPRGKPSARPGADGLAEVKGKVGGTGRGTMSCWEQGIPGWGQI